MAESYHDFQEMMTDALDGRLGPTERAHFERLLAESPERRREWDALQEMRARLQAVGTSAAPDGLSARVAAAIRQEMGSGSMPQPNEEPAPVAAAPAPSAWSHWRAMGAARAAAVIAVLIAVASILLEQKISDDATSASRPIVAADEEALGNDGAKSEASEREAKRSFRAGGAEGVTSVIGEPEVSEDALAAEGARQKPKSMDLERRLAFVAGGRIVPLITKLELLENALSDSGGMRRENPDAQQSGGPPEMRGLNRDGVLGEALWFVGRNLRRFSAEELDSEGFGQLAVDMDTAVDLWLAESSKPRTQPAPSAGGRPRPRAKATSPTVRAGAPTGGMDRRSRGRADLAAPKPAPKPGGAKTSKLRGGQRMFFTVIGKDAQQRVKALLGGLEGIRESSAAEAFGRSRKSSGSAANAKPAERRGVYRVYEVPLQEREATALIARLESLAGLTLRSLGASKLPEGSGAPTGAGADRPRVLVLVIVDR